MKKTLALALLMGLSGCGADATDKVARAREEIARMELAAAKVDLSAALAEQGDSAELLRLLAAVQLRMGDGDGAASTAARLEKLGERGPELARIRAEAALLRGRPDEALTLLGKDGAPQAWRVRAAAHLALDDTAAAVDAFRRGEAAGKDAMLLRDHAQFLIGAEDLTAAEQRVAQIQKLAPDGYDALMLTGEIAARRGRFDAAHSAFAKAAERFPRAPEPLLARASAFERAEQKDKAAEMVAKAAALAPEDPRVIALQVQMATARQDWQKVRDTLASEEAKLDPVSDNGIAYAQALLFLGQREQARSMLQRAFLRAPGNPRVRLLLAGAQMATDDPRAAYATVMPLADSLIADTPELELAETAARALELESEAERWEAKRLSSQRAQALELAGKAEDALLREQWDIGIAAYRTIAAQGDDAEIYRRLALALSRSGKGDEAIAMADKARALVPADADLIHLSGYVRAVAGKEPDTARRLLLEASQADPRNPVYRKSLARWGGQGSEG
ncbi:MAG: hypothetical protein B7Y36_03245 [Novosphingobium sp. 28-62-57]|uniref:tetratricopeptide repeat protein n=1 Tax=unclassified Novosphingobium TaxID=2644732 RepID=UPI000BCA9F83|nr:MULTISPECIES: tetratricopeptide repeat protein [unclassified Novosphingobium]OYZ12532.1 MAG: hypothetical protein B7Y36_03245 [Novosphingobium sp. 28-62-57]HQS70864.1 tetratricopeptide repeat protein [Novosphingobium sp.]